MPSNLSAKRHRISRRDTISLQLEGGATASIPLAASLLHRPAGSNPIPNPNPNPIPNPNPNPNLVPDHATRAPTLTSTLTLTLTLTLTPSLTYKQDADGIVYIVDAMDRERFPEVG